LLQTPSSDFDGLVAAAQLVWNSAAQNVEWDVEQSVSTTDMGRASEASLFLSDKLRGLTADQERRISSSLDRASGQSSGLEPELAKALASASTGLRTRDHAPATRALVEASRRFAEANNRREDAVALEDVLAQLNKGREQIAQAGRPQNKKAQVGFRRRGMPGSSATSTPNLEDFDTDGQVAQAGQTGGQSNSNVSGMGPVVGQNNVASYTGAPSTSGEGGQPAKVGGQDGNGSQGGGPGGGTNGADVGQPGGSQQSAGGGSAGGGTSDAGEQGTLGGSINGPVGGASGAISQVPNPAGRGNSTADSAGATPEDRGNASGGEQVYVPEGNESGGTPRSEAGLGSPDPSDHANTEGIEGRVGEGASEGAEGSSATGPGGAVRVQTPYREVLAEYARQATEAIDRAYVPPDAKQYVKDYFSELGK
jgi:hypothetical protein